MALPRLDLLIVADSVEGGLGAAALAHARWFVTRGWRVGLASPGLPQEFRQDGVVAVPLPGVESGLDGRAVMEAAQALRRWLHDSPARVVHAHGTRSQLLCLLAGERPFVTMHGAGGRVPGQGRAGSLTRRASRAIAPWFARRAYSVSPAGPGWRTTLHASPRLPELGRMVEVATTDPPQFLWLGRLDVPKEPMVFVRACAEAARSRDIRGVVAGDGPLRPALEREARRLGAPVTFLGETTGIAAHLERAWAVCLFSGFEGVPFSVQEAMWAGRAVVLSPLPSLRWFAGSAACFVSGVDAAAAALVELSDPAVARARGAAASERARWQLSSGDPFPAFLADYERRR